MGDFRRMEMQHVSFQNVLQRKLLQAYGKNTDTRMGCEMTVIVRANGEASTASVRSIPA